LFYQIIKLFALMAMKIFCPFLVIANKEALDKKGPALLIANHPNSFLDAIIIGLQCRQPIYFLVRGDAFRKIWHRKTLRFLHMLPVYRQRDVQEIMHLNDVSFRAAHGLLEKGCIVLIFIEGICENQHTLQPFKKGAARIAWAAREIANFHVLPIGIAYDSFSGIGKSVQIHVGESMTPAQLMQKETVALNYLQFNQILFNQLNQLIRVPKKLKRHPQNLIAFVGLALHYFFYKMISNQIRNKTAGTVFYDSVLFGVLLIVYPFYLLALAAILLLAGVTPLIVFLILLLHIVSARFYVMAVEHKK
jgi:1-acyl-sn-glycerol-3-phosphate acyltransferase